jgi:hypothetical protein
MRACVHRVLCARERDPAGRIAGHAASLLAIATCAPHARTRTCGHSAHTPSEPACADTAPLRPCSRRAVPARPRGPLRHVLPPQQLRQAEPEVLHRWLGGVQEQRPHVFQRPLRVVRRRVAAAVHWCGDNPPPPSVARLEQICARLWPLHFAWRQVASAIAIALASSQCTIVAMACACAHCHSEDMFVQPDVESSVQALAPGLASGDSKSSTASACRSPRNVCPLRGSCNRCSGAHRDCRWPLCLRRDSLLAARSTGATAAALARPLAAVAAGPSLT